MQRLSVWLRLSLLTNGSEVVTSEHRKANSVGCRLDNQGSVAELPADSPDPVAG